MDSDDLPETPNTSDMKYSDNDSIINSSSSSSSTSVRLLYLNLQLKLLISIFNSYKNYIFFRIQMKLQDLMMIFHHQFPIQNLNQEILILMNQC